MSGAKRPIRSGKLSGGLIGLGPHRNLSLGMNEPVSESSHLLAGFFLVGGGREVRAPVSTGTYDTPGCPPHPSGSSALRFNRARESHRVAVGGPVVGVSAWARRVSQRR